MDVIQECCVGDYKNKLKGILVVEKVESKNKNFLKSPAVKFLLSDDDFTSSSHVLSGLCSSLVASSLETNDSFSSGNSVFIEITNILIGWFWSEPWSLPFWMSVCLDG